MNASDFDFAGLGQALLDQASMSDYARRTAMLAPFRAELAMLLVGMRKAQIIGSNERPPDPAEACDACDTELKVSGLYVDGKLQDGGGMWANMCLTCFLEQGTSIGWGVGQLYAYDGVGWQCIGGGSPEPEIVEEE